MQEAEEHFKTYFTGVLLSSVDDISIYEGGQESGEAGRQGEATAIEGVVRRLLLLLRTCACRGGRWMKKCGMPFYIWEPGTQQLVCKLSQGCWLTMVEDPSHAHYTTATPLLPTR